MSEQKESWVIQSGGEFFEVNEKGYIRRYRYCENTEGFSGSWAALALVRMNNFGYVIEKIPFVSWEDDLPAKKDQLFKNGKSKWRLIDYDHGTKRMWGRPVTVTKMWI